MSTYMENIYNNNENNNFQSTYDSIINELINLENLTPDKSRATFLESIFKQLCTVTNSSAAFIFELFNKNIYELKFKYLKNSYHLSDTLPDIFSAETIPDWHSRLSKRQIIIETDIKDSSTAMTDENNKLLNAGINSVIAFPISYAGNFLGYIRLDAPSFPILPFHLMLMRTIGMHLGSIWQNIDKDFLLMQRQDIINENKSELEKEKQFLDVLCRDYTSVYYVDLEKNTLELLKLDRIANAANFIPVENPKPLDYTETIKIYAEKYIASESTDFFKKTMDIQNLKDELKNKERLVFRYRSVPNLLRQQYFETVIVRISLTVSDYKLLLGFRHIDDIVAIEQKKQFELEQALAEANLKNEVISALSQIYYTIFLIDLEKDTFKEISGKSGSHRLAGKTGCASYEMNKLCNEFIVPEYKDRLLQFFDISTLAKRLENEETIATEYLTTDNNWHTARFIVRKRNEANTVTDVLYVTQIISASKRREQSWISIAEEANKANVAKTEFISQIAHDIRTPMNAIMGFTDIAATHLTEPDKVKYSLEKIKLSGNFLLELVNEVLDISKIENGQMKITPKEINICEIFDEFPPLLEQIKLGKDLDIKCFKHDILYSELFADPLRIKQIYTNILSNAIKYTPDGGSIVFEMYQQEIPGSKNIRLIAKVSDTGIGMSKEYIENMYSKFTRETDSRINKVPGYGLGLSIVKYLTDIMNGSIDVQSELGKGTTFTVTLELPYLKERSKNATETLTIEYYSKICSGMNLLIAEDNELNYEVISELLKMHGITCEHASDGSICVEMLKNSKKHTYDAILMDMQMPVMNGLYATTAIRNMNSSEAHTIPIIAMTANAFKEDIEKCLNAGMNKYLSKPVDIFKLLKVLSEFRN